MHKVLMVRPCWEKGYIDKHLVASLNLEEVAEIYSFDPEPLSHYQFIKAGDHLIRIRHCLRTNTLSETIYLYSEPNPIVVNKRAVVGPKVKEYLEIMRKPEYMLFSILRGLNEMTSPKFDCPIRMVRRLIQEVSVLDNEMYEFIMQELKFSYEKDCPTSFSNAAKKPKWLNVRERLTTNTDGTTANHTSEHWLLIHKSGVVEMPELQPTKGAHIDAATGRTLEVYNAPPRQMPDDIYRAIKITIGVNEVEGKLRGVALKLYRN